MHIEHSRILHFRHQRRTSDESSETLSGGGRLPNPVLLLEDIAIRSLARAEADAPASLARAQGQAECLDYLLEVAVKMKLAGMDCEGLDQFATRASK